MKLIGFKSPTGPRIGRIQGDVVRDLGPLDSFYNAPDEAVLNASDQDLALADLEQVPPIPSTARIFCVGINYRSHAAEAETAGLEEPTVPVIFGRWPSTLVVDGAPVPVPPNEPGLDWEAELAVVIGKPTWLATKQNALDSVFGYTAFNDLSARLKQTASTQWTLGKNADRSGPIGPVIVTADEIPDPHALEISLRVNGQELQRANTSELLQDIPAVIAWITDTATLQPGDVIVTGTMAGIGHAMTPPKYLHPGDVVEVEIESIGVLTTPIVGANEYRTAAPLAAAVGR